MKNNDIWLTDHSQTLTGSTVYGGHLYMPNSHMLIEWKDYEVNIHADYRLDYGMTI